MHKNVNFLGLTNEHPPFGLCLRRDNDINEALSASMHVNYYKQIRSYKMPAYTSFISDVRKFYRVENSFASPDIFTYQD